MRPARVTPPAAQVRGADLQSIIDCVRHGICCSVVGPSNSGKSSLVRSLAVDGVRKLCGPDEVGPPPAVIFVDCLEAGETADTFCELLVRHILRTLEETHKVSSVLSALRELYDEMLRGTTEVGLRSLFANTLHEVSQASEFGLLLVLDEFDDAFRVLPAWPFRQLRAVRDAMGNRVSYITVTSRRLDDLRSDDETYEFRELFHASTRFLRPLSDEESAQLIRFLCQTRGLTVREDQVALVVGLSGGHPGLAGHLCRLLSPGVSGAGNERQSFLDRIREDWAIEQECRRLWSDLEDDERSGLIRLVGVPGPIDGRAAIRCLETKGLAREDKSGRLTVFSPVLESFISRLSVSSVRTGGVYCEAKTGQVWVDGRELTADLSEQQRRLVRLLYEREGGVCTYAEIISEVWGVASGVSQGAVYEMVKRVRQKIEPVWQQPRYIVTLDGEGYRLNRAQ